LDGPPGIGKTLFVHDLAGALQNAFEVISCSNLTAGFEIGDASWVWETGRPGRVVEAIARSRVINPIIMLDELDKAGDSQGQVEALYSLLEPITAKTFKDEGLSIPTNCSHINWIATCNDYNRLSPAIQSRFRRFKIVAPNREQLVSVIHSVFNDLITENRWGQGFEDRLSDETTRLIADKQVSPRLLKGVLRDACSNAALRYKRDDRLHREKIVLRSEDICLGKHMQETRSIGFIQ